MNRLFPRGAHAALLSIVLLASGGLQAASVTISNHSFEDVGLAAGGWSNSTPDWSEDVQDSNGSFTEFITGFSAEGTHHLGINSLTSAINAGIIPAGTQEYAVFQNLGLALQPNTLYELTVAIGNRNAFTTAGNMSGFSLRLDTGAILEQTVVDASTFPVSSFVDQSLTFMTGANPAAGNLVVALSNIDLQGTNSRSHFDNVRLTATTIPEPGAPALLVLAGVLGALSRRRHRRT